MPADELARRFKLDSVAHSAGVFDEDKLAWANRHYLKLARPDRLAALAEPFLRQRAPDRRRSVTPRGRGWLEACCQAWPRRSIACRSSPIGLDTRVCVRCRRDAGRALCAELREPECDGGGTRSSPRNCSTPARLTSKEAFRAAANRVKERTGQKGKALFHPIRLA